MEFTLVKLYAALLESLGCVINLSGAVSIRVEDESSVPYTIAGRRLVLPYDEQLKEPDWSNRVLMNPLAESSLDKTESVVVESLRKFVTVSFNAEISKVLLWMTDVAASTGLQAGLTQDQKDFLIHAPKMDEKSIKTLRSILDKRAASDAATVVARTYIKRGGLYQGVKRSRVGVVNFPLYEALVEAQGTKERVVDSVKCRVEELDTFVRLIEHIVPEIAVAEAYNVWSEDKVAPFFDVLLKMYQRLTTVLVDLAATYPNAGVQVTSNGWDVLVGNFEAYMRDLALLPRSSASGEFQVGSVKQDKAAPAVSARNDPPWEDPREVPEERARYVSRNERSGRDDYDDRGRDRDDRYDRDRPVSNGKVSWQDHKRQRDVRERDDRYDRGRDDRYDEPRRPFQGRDRDDRYDRGRDRDRGRSNRDSSRRF